VGYVQPGSNGAVTAAKVYNLHPSMVTLPLKIVQVNNQDDAAVEEDMPFDNLGGHSQKQETPEEIELKKKYHKNNGLLILNFNDQAENEKKFALYRYDHQKQAPSALSKIALGKRPPPKSISELEAVTQFEHIKNYSFSQYHNKSKEEFIVQFDEKADKVLYHPIATKLALLKKKRSMYENEATNAKFLQIVPRGLTLKETEKIGKVYSTE
jgi:hypothetical protein